MKKFLVFFMMMFLYVITTLSSQNIQEITSITHNRKVIDYTQYSGSIVGKGDRLFVSTYRSLEELLVKEDGNLERISIHEQGRISPSSIIDEDKLFSFYSGANLEGYMMIFDISTTPMTNITTIENIFAPFQRPSVMGDYVILALNSIYEPGKFNKHTFMFESGSIPVGTGIYVVKDTIFISAWMREQGYLLRFFDYEDILGGGIPVPIYFLDLFLDAELENKPESLQVIDDHLFVLCIGYLVVYDIGDMENVHKVLSLSSDTRMAYKDALYYENLLIVSYQHSINSDGIQFWDISDNSNPVLLKEVEIDLAGFPNGLYISEDRLYVNAVYYLSTFDLRDNFQEIDRYGNHITDFSINREYMVENSRLSNEVKIYSLLDDDPEIIVIKHGYEKGDYVLRDFEIRDSLLYVVSRVRNEISYFEIYELGNMELLHRSPLSHRAEEVRLFGDYVLVRENRNNEPSFCYVYQLIADELLYVDMFVGRIEERSGIEKNYFLSLNIVELSFRSIVNPLEIIHTEINNQFSWRNIRRIDENTIAFSDTEYGQIFIYDENYVFTSTQNLNYPNRSVNFYNGIMVVNALYGNLTEFFAVENGVPRKIGAMDIDLNRHTSIARIFPEKYKIIVRYSSRIDVYDMEYTVSEGEDIDVPIVRSELLGNFPNPFNPETTIRFNVGNAFIRSESVRVSIDIYNIRGQKVRSLLDGFYESGSHTVVWDGRDDSGRELGSGVYLYRMLAGEESSVRKMVLLK